jgi:preprotein translocase subunit YajC
LTVKLHFGLIVGALVATPLASPLMAQDAAAPAATTAPAANVTAGAAVMDTKGGMVGTVASVTGNLAVVDTGVVKASMPTSSFAQSDKGLVIAMTKTELEAAAKNAAQGNASEVAALLKPGADVTDSNGGAVGKIEAVDASTAVVAASSSKFRLPKTAFAKGPNGLMIGMTLAQLEAAAKASGPS